MHTVLSEDADSVMSKVDLSLLLGKRVLVTGASGLVGINIVAAIKKTMALGHIDLWCWFREEIDPCFSGVFDGCKIIRGDITDSTMFSDLPQFDYIIHSSGYAQPSKFLEDKIKTIELNTTSTILLLKHLDKNGTFLFVSTSEIYSGLDVHNINETQVGTSNTDHPRSCYIEGKRTGEAICHAYAQKGYNIKIARLSSAYGAGTKRNDKRVLNTLIEKGLTKPSIDLLDDGSAIRTFCYVSDVTEMLLNIMLLDKSTTYNVGGVYELSIYELARRIGNIMNKPVFKSTKESSMAGNPKIVNVSIQKYMEEFGKTVEDFTDFDTGLKRTILWQTQFA